MSIVLVLPSNQLTLCPLARDLEISSGDLFPSLCSLWDYVSAQVDHLVFIFLNCWVWRVYLKKNIFWIQVFCWTCSLQTWSILARLQSAVDVSCGRCSRVPQTRCWNTEALLLTDAEAGSLRTKREVQAGRRCSRRPPLLPESLHVIFPLSASVSESVTPLPIRMPAVLDCDRLWWSYSNRMASVKIYWQIKPHSEVLGIRAAARGFERENVELIILVFSFSEVFYSKSFEFWWSPMYPLFPLWVSCDI